MDTLTLLKMGLVAVKELHNQAMKNSVIYEYNPYELEKMFEDKIKEFEKAELFEVKKN